MVVHMSSMEGDVRQRPLIISPWPSHGDGMQLVSICKAWRVMSGRDLSSLVLGLHMEMACNGCPYVKHGG